MEASEQQVAEPQAEEQTPETSTDAPSDDVREQIAALTERVDSIGKPPAGPTPDLAEALAGGDGGEPEPEEEYPGFENESLYQPEAEEFQSPEELNAYLQERDERLTNLEARYAEDAENRNLAELEAVTEKYPPLKAELDKYQQTGQLAPNSLIARIRDQLQPLAEQRGDPNLVLDPRLVELTYKALMADEASASEVPAEEAANRGATLETGAGPGNLQEDRSYSDEKGDQIVNAGMRKSAFT